MWLFTAFWPHQYRDGFQQLLMQLFACKWQQILCVLCLQRFQVTKSRDKICKSVLVFGFPDPVCGISFWASWLLRPFTSSHLDVVLLNVRYHWWVASKSRTNNSWTVVKGTLTLQKWHNRFPQDLLSVVIQQQSFFSSAETRRSCKAGHEHTEVCCRFISVFFDHMSTGPAQKWSCTPPNTQLARPKTELYVRQFLKGYVSWKEGT